MIPLTVEENELYKMQKVCYICKKIFSTDKNDKNVFKLYHKVRDHCHYTGKFRGAAHSICNLRYKTPKEIQVVFHNGSTYDYHFILKQLSKEFKGKFDCLGENTEKYITFSAPIYKKNDNDETIIYKLKFIDSFRFMSTSLSSLVDNLSEIYKKECKGCEEKRKIKSVCNFIGLKNNKLNYECKECKKRSLKPINKLIKRFPNVYLFCSEDINKFVLLLRKVVYPYEYMSSWERFNETSLPNKKAFYNELYLEDITNKDYAHVQKIFEEFNSKNLGDYHDFYVRINTLSLADVFENFRNKCIEIYKLYPAYFCQHQDQHGIV